MQSLSLLGLNHQSAPLAVREKLAFSSDQRAAALAALHARFATCEFAILSTCNRVEIYLARTPHTAPHRSDLEQFLAEFHDLAPADFAPHLYEKNHRAAVEHLFNVTASLDSMVLGETQILGQVREAYEAARVGGTAGRMLHPLFQRAVAVGKQVLGTTPLAEGRASVASVAVDFTRRIFDQFADKTVLCIGAGKMAALVLTNLAALAPEELIVCNRDPEKAAALAARFSGSAQPLDRLADVLAAADIVLTSTGSAHPIITRTLFETVMRRRYYRPVFLIDIAVPRDVDPDVAKIQNVYLYNLDDLQQVVAATRQQRTQAVDAAQKIVAEHVAEFADWHRARQLGPIIDQLYRRSHELAQEELARALARLPNISPAEREHLADLSRRIVNKLLHDPIQMLRESADHLPAATYLHAMEKLFKLPHDVAGEPTGEPRTESHKNPHDDQPDADSE